MSSCEFGIFFGVYLIDHGLYQQVSESLPSGLADARRLATKYRRKAHEFGSFLLSSFDEVRSWKCDLPLREKNQENLGRFCFSL